MSAANMATMPEFDIPQIDRLLTTTRAVRKRLDLDRPVEQAVIPVAYYTGRDFRPAVRRPAEEVTYWNTWNATRNDG